MATPDVRAGEWVLIATLRGALVDEDGRLTTASGVIARGSNPAEPPGLEGFQQIRRLGLTRDQEDKLVHAPVLTAIRTHELAYGTQIERGARLFAVAEPVISGRGRVHAVWLWIGPTRTPTHPHVVTGAWEWYLDRFTVTYGPKIPQIYGQEWEVGKEYPIGQTTSTYRSADMETGAAIVGAREDGVRHPMRVVAARPAHGSRARDKLVTLRAMTEIVHEGGEVTWRGVTWDVTAFDEPSETPDSASKQRFARQAEGWTATLWWDASMAQVGAWHGGRTLEDHVWVDPETNRVRVHPDQQEIPRRLLHELERDDEAEGTFAVWGRDEEWHDYHFSAERIHTATAPACADLRIVSVHPVDDESFDVANGTR